METIAKELDVSVILPVYNERGHLKAEIDRVRTALSASSYSFEIIVIDDGSNDGSELDLPLIPDIRLIRHSVNRGSGAARRTGTDKRLEGRRFTRNSAGQRGTSLLN